MNKEGTSTARPPLLTGDNYAYWKSRMMIHLSSIDELCWYCITNEWKAPTSTKDDVTINTPMTEWTAVEKALYLSDRKALNTIFNAVDMKTHSLISTSTTAKKAWDILETVYEGTKSVRISRLQNLITQFENLRMEETETIGDFNARVRSISNDSFALGEPMSDERLVRKVLRSLPQRFAYKVAAVGIN